MLRATHRYCWPVVVGGSTSDRALYGLATVDVPDSPCLVLEVVPSDQASSSYVSSVMTLVELVQAVHVDMDVVAHNCNVM